MSATARPIHGTYRPHPLHRFLQAKFESSLDPPGYVKQSRPHHLSITS
ncbi:hypothetical protein SLEP1_g6281 [Rubroshorea leprosula]|uniref:Uncharacterized protein n=1 Tax=Rubroshorea leprosula TaxID=152421 RepID=A0AAV5I0N0_9ROSI|nr:hypothetical protein SLEP1_g6281 [Rubroshorea leprosula]